MMRDYTPPAVCQDIVRVLRENNSFFLIPHVHMDGDALGSMLALALALQALGKKTYLYSPDKIPDAYQVMPAVEQVQKVPPTEAYDVAVLIEVPSLNRAPGGVVPRSIAKTIINLDHHEHNDNPCDFKWVDTTMSALGEMIALIIEAMNVEMNSKIATALYIAIASDSGRFQYKAVSSRTHAIVARFVDYVETERVSRSMYSKSPREFELTKRMINQVQVSEDGKIVWADLTQDMLDDTGVLIEDTQNLVAELNCIRGSEVFALFKYTEKDRVRVSLRSTGAHVNEVARHFGGGGHVQAAACSLAGCDLEKAHKIMLEALRRLLESESAGGETPA